MLRMLAGWSWPSRRPSLPPMLSLALVLVSLVLAAFPAVSGVSLPVICEVPGLGVLIGRTASSADNASFSAFEGVPYAQPPVGHLRFQPAVPVTSFNVMDARSTRLPCPYLNGGGRVIGLEDCLYLNVYTPQVKESLAMAVLVVLPGEDWTRGFAGRWHPHRLVDRGVVVVTVQSRLGALGFLSTGTSAAPGNLGLKDERLALTWVRQNIRAFGGDPHRVTLAGVGAGAAAVMLHSLSSPGLFQRAIAISGSALSPLLGPWSLAEAEAVDDPRSAVRRLAEAVGCDCPVRVETTANATANVTATNPLVQMNTTVANITATTANLTVTSSSSSRPANVSEILECLRTKPVADIVYGTARLQGWAGLPPSPFGPVVERHHAKDTVLEDAPGRLWSARTGNTSVPILIGLARSEGLETLGAPWRGLLNRNSSLLAQLDADWGRLAPALLSFNATDDAALRAAAEQVRRRYLGAAKLADAMDGLLWLYGDRHIVVPTLRAAALRADKHPVYLYRFAWNAAQGASLMGGPAGGSDAQFLLMQPHPNEVANTPEHRAMASDLLDIWASFITTGVPTVGNTTLPRVSSPNVTASELPFVELVRPGVQRTGNWSVKELFAFWDGLPILENQKPPRATAGSQTDTRRSERSSASATRQNLLPALLLVCLRFLAQ